MWEEGGNGEGAEQAGRGSRWQPAARECDLITKAFEMKGGLYGKRQKSMEPKDGTDTKGVKEQDGNV